jgi:hypothetical protein
LHECVKRLVRHEEAIAGLYACFAASLPAVAKFWQRLSTEEMGHAGMLRVLADRIQTGAVTGSRDRFPWGELEQSLDFVTQTLNGWTHQPGTREDAYEIARFLESGLLESDYFSVFDTDDMAIRQSFDFLRRETSKHLEELQALGTGDLQP